VELHYGTQGKKGKEKKMIVSNIEMHYICEGRGHNCVLKVVEQWRMGGKG
jgi:hypothetical protein